MDTELRGMLKGMIMAQPGVHYRWLKKNSGRANGTVAYHLKKLEEDEEIRSERDGILKRYYPVQKKQIRIRKAIPEAIISLLMTNPDGTSQSEIAYVLDESKQNIYYHMNKLMDSGKVSVEKDEKGHTRYFLVQND